VNTEITDETGFLKSLTMRLKRHPVPVSALFGRCLVLTYALPARGLEPLLPPGLSLDTFHGYGFVAIALVQTESLRPACLPAMFGQDFFLSGYRIFARYRTRAGRNLRGLRILRSDTDRYRMVFFGNLLTHYHYRLAQVEVDERAGELEVRIQTPRAEADLHVVANLGAPPEALPPSSPFADWHEARRFAGPLPFTFDYEEQTHSLVLIEGVRKFWKPQPVGVKVLENTFFRSAAFRDAQPILASAFHLRNVPYGWKRGVVEKLN
jgi:uncharacterized protein YqjF (DUF2071 family)